MRGREAGATGQRSVAPAPGRPQRVALPSMNLLRLLLPAILGLAWLTGGLRAQSPALQDLAVLAERQRTLLGRAAAAEDQVAVDDLRPQLQRLVFDYEAFLRDHPEFAPGYVSYALLLGNPLIDERRRAAALLLRANTLDPDLPVVKNQLGNYLAEEGRPLEAINYFLAAVQLAPEEPLYHYQIGTLLTEARDDFLQSGEWTRAALDEAMHHGFRRAAELAPDRLQYAYRYAESFYDLEHPEWAEALAVWQALERRVETSLERQTMRLHQANIRLKQGRPDEAKALLRTVEAEPLQGQKRKLEAQLP